MEQLESEVLRRREAKESCSRATLMALCGVLAKPGMTIPDEAVLDSISCGFRGGIGRTFGEGVCGAISGGVIAAGLLCAPDNAKAENVARKLYLAFIDRYGTVSCGRIAKEGHHGCTRCCLLAARTVAENIN